MVIAPASNYISWLDDVFRGRIGLMQGGHWETGVRLQPRVHAVDQVYHLPKMLRRRVSKQFPVIYITPSPRVKCFGTEIWMGGLGGTGNTRIPPEKHIFPEPAKLFRFIVSPILAFFKAPSPTNIFHSCSGIAGMLDFSLRDSRRYITANGTSQLSVCQPTKWRSHFRQTHRKGGEKYPAITPSVKSVTNASPMEGSGNGLSITFNGKKLFRITRRFLHLPQNTLWKRPHRRFTLNTLRSNEAESYSAKITILIRYCNLRFRFHCTQIAWMSLHLYRVGRNKMVVLTWVLRWRNS